MSVVCPRVCETGTVCAGCGRGTVLPQRECPYECTTKSGSCIHVYHPTLFGGQVKK